MLLLFVLAMAGVGTSPSPNAAGVIPCLLWKESNDKLIMAATASTAQVDHCWAQAEHAMIRTGNDQVENCMICGWRPMPWPHSHTEQCGLKCRPPTHCSRHTHPRTPAPPQWAATPGQNAQVPELTFTALGHMCPAASQISLWLTKCLFLLACGSKSQAHHMHTDQGGSEGVSLVTIVLLSFSPRSCSSTVCGREAYRRSVSVSCRCSMLEGSRRDHQ